MDAKVIGVCLARATASPSLAACQETPLRYILHIEVDPIGLDQQRIHLGINHAPASLTLVPVLHDHVIGTEAWPQIDIAREAHSDACGNTLGAQQRAEHRREVTATTYQPLLRCSIFAQGTRVSFKN